jgi:hypothetical protein
MSASGERDSRLVFDNQNPLHGSPRGVQPMVKRLPGQARWQRGFLRGPYDLADHRETDAGPLDATGFGFGA